MSTQLQFTSDLHLEFPANKEFLMRNPIKPVGEVLLLAGDVVPFAEMHKHQDFFSYVSDHFEKTYWVPGNHEYYRADINERSGVVHESIRENVWLVNNTVVNHGPVRMVCSTLWSQISPAHQWEIERNMSDFRLIRNGAHRFTSDRYNELHAESLAFLKNALAEPWQGHTVVCSHHCPTFMHYPEQYRGDVLNEAFATELFDLIEESGIHAWIYGHHHTNTPEFTIGSARMLTNQLGYVEYGEGVGYEQSKSIML